MPIQAPIKVRIAPSPSGYLHVGTARTAIFNWLYARKHGGKFVIRIEDTDAERSDASLVQPIIDALKWLGIESDEPIVYQSEREELHRRYVTKLLESGHGYRCFCTKEDLDAQREKTAQEKRAPRYDRRCAGLSSAEIEKRLAQGALFAVRLRIPDESSTTYHDLILGDITRDNSEIEDLVVARSDGRALYNFAVVVDDFEMGITDIIRGNDHITNTFKQIHIYRALGMPLPRFGHVPLLLRPDKQKVSKRLGDKDVAEYGTEGVLPETMFNYLCLLGWSPKDGREIMSRAELIQAFSVEGVNANNPVFDEQKLVAFNKDYIKNAPLERLVELVSQNIIATGLVTAGWLTDEANRVYLGKVIDLMRERLRVINDFTPLAGFFFTDNYSYDPEGVQKRFLPEAAARLTRLGEVFAEAPFTHDGLEQTLDSVATECGVKRADLIHPTRLAVSGLTQGPSLFEMLVVIGRDRVVARLRRAVTQILSAGSQVST